MAAALKGLGFQVETVLNGSLEQMEKAVERLRNRLSANNGAYGFLFYAGHGVQSNGENFLIPADAAINNESTLRLRALSVQVVLDELNQAGNALNIVVLDACRNNPFGWARGGARGLQVVGVQPADSIIVYATAAGSVAADGSGRNGLFTSHLLNNLKTPGIEIREVFRRTGESVSRASNQEQRPAVYDQFYGTVYLAGGATPAVVPVVPVNPPPNVPADMVRVSGGTFMMGSPGNEANRQSNEEQHQVTVGSFLIGKYEVTQKEWIEVMGSNPSYFKGDNLPVEQVSWDEVIEYCNKRSVKEGLMPAYTVSGTTVTWNRSASGYRLPTEEEWEFAARGGSGAGYLIYAGSNSVDSVGWYWDNSGSKTHPVGTKAANGLGLYDMSGNVWEWCWDWYGAYSTSSVTDPMGASSGSYRVFRGGSWSFSGQYLRSAYRIYSTPSLRNFDIGFRLVRPL
jgi:formylglycine-generating enzyme required for sulfatase activity